MSKVLVFDSGKGGEYVAQKAAERFREIEIDFVADYKGLPYGDKTASQIVASAKLALTPVIESYDIIVIACHTLTEVGIDNLRKSYPNKTFIGFDPGIKIARDLGFNKICVLATPVSLASSRYQGLKESLDFTEVIEPDCKSWAKNIENESFDSKKMTAAVANSKAPCVVLACTHYFWYEGLLKDHFPNLTIVNPTQAVLDQLGRSLTS